LSSRPAGAAQAVAVVDGGSFVLPYDHGLIGGLLRQGHAVTVFASRTRYNAEFLDDLRTMPGVTVVDRAVSGSVASRLQGVLGYAGLLLALWRQRHRFTVINLQFSVLWPLELPLWWLLRRQLVYTVHNAVPHGQAGLQHAPTRWTALLARQLVFVSEATRDDFLRRYGEGFRAKASVLPHGLLPIAPRDAVQPVRACAEPQALVFWGTVKGYKGIELFADLARSAVWKSQGLPLEIHGRWDTELHPLRDELIALGVRVEDRYLDAAAMRELMAREVLFVLPYRDASQSGALYTLLHQGCTFACRDVGDLGAFLRRFHLQGLLLPERSTAAVLQALQHLRQHATELAQSLRTAQQQTTWDITLADAASVYGPVPRT
jgi:glycosyltransferase involved in cell wall biosynthesis